MLFRLIAILLLAFSANATLSAHSLEGTDPADGHKKIEAALQQIRGAALASDPETIAHIFAEDMVLVSQSGSVYGKEAVLFDLTNGFESWDNSEIVFHSSGDAIVVSLVNQRQRSGMDTARFRVMQLWNKIGGSWFLKAQSSVRLKN